MEAGLLASIIRVTHGAGRQEGDRIYFCELRIMSNKATTNNIVALSIVKQVRFTQLPDNPSMGDGPCV